MSTGDETQHEPSPSGGLGRESISDVDRIQELRERLYARGSEKIGSTRHELPKPDYIVRKTPVSSPTPAPAPVDILPDEDDDVTMKKKSWSIRKIALVSCGVFFLIALGVSAVLMLLGTKTISGENISLSAQGPLVVSGGGTFDYVVTVSNQNTVPIERATLIVEYPRGTRSVGDDAKEITTERIQLDTISAGELVTIPLTAQIFGEENEEKSIRVAVDYRVGGSNATFKKSADPLNFRVSTAPVVLTLDGVERIASGQKVTLKLTVQSNSPTELTDLVVQMQYPEGFDVTSADPASTYGNEVWSIAKLGPNEKRAITVTGNISGLAGDDKKFSAGIGVAQDQSRTTFTSALSRTTYAVAIEKPFLDIDVSVNGSTANDVVIEGNDTALVEVVFKNTLPTLIRNGKIQVTLEGNALNDFEVRTTNGFFDSLTNTITWDGTDVKDLAEIQPKDYSLVRFSLIPRLDVERAPEVTFQVSALGERSDGNTDAREMLEGVVSRTIRVVSTPKLESVALYETGPFVNSGPVPPVAERVTQYTYMLSVQAGSNDLGEAVVTAILPQYMTWLDITSSPLVAYNPTTRLLTWTVGDIPAGTRKEVFVQVSLRPSLTQVGTVPIILNTQSLKAVDRFTGTSVQTSGGALNTSLIQEENIELHNGTVVRP